MINLFKMFESPNLIDKNNANNIIRMTRLLVKLKTLEKILDDKSNN